MAKAKGRASTVPLAPPRSFSRAPGVQTAQALLWNTSTGLAESGVIRPIAAGGMTEGASNPAVLDEEHTRHPPHVGARPACAMPVEHRCAEPPPEHPR